MFVRYNLSPRPLKIAQYGRTTPFLLVLNFANIQDCEQCDQIGLILKVLLRVGQIFGDFLGYLDC